MKTDNCKEVYATHILCFYKPIHQESSNREENMRTFNLHESDFVLFNATYNDGEVKELDIDLLLPKS